MKNIKNYSLLFLFAVGLGGGTVLSTGYFLWKNYSLGLENIALEKEIQKESQEIILLSERGALEDLKRAVSILEKAEQYRIPWSKIVGEVFRQESAGITFTSFSAGREKRINLSGDASSLEIVAQLLERVKSNPNIAKPFLYSVSERTDPGRKKGYNFSLSFNFIDGSL